MYEKVTKTAGLFLLVSCGDSSDLLPLEDYEKVEVVPFFFYEDSDQHIELQTVTGASNCRIAARAFAASNTVSGNVLAVMWLWGRMQFRLRSQALNTSVVHVMITQQ